MHLCQMERTLDMEDMQRFENGEDQDWAQQIFIDVPQKDKAYKESKTKMEKEKERLIEDHYLINVKVKQKREYDVGGRVQGAKRSEEFNGRLGTISKVMSEKEQYKIKW